MRLDAFAVQTLQQIHLALYLRAEGLALEMALAGLFLFIDN